MIYFILSLYKIFYDFYFLFQRDNVVHDLEIIDQAESKLGRRTGKQPPVFMTH